MDTITSINPYNGDVLGHYALYNDKEVMAAAQRSVKTFGLWAASTLKDRMLPLLKMSKLLLRNKSNYAKLISLEMGKPIVESLAEVEKCAWVCTYYLDQAEGFLGDEAISTDASSSLVRHDPLGPILGIMPWNFPFWQVFRFAVPTLTAGNTVLLKHAANVSGCANALEQIFLDAGYPESCFQNLIIDHNQVERLIAMDAVRAVSLTGSEGAGRKVASLAGQHLKKTVLELGGNNACVVWEDADLDRYIGLMVKARMQNTGQSCIAAKRFIVVDAIYDDFMDAFTARIGQIKLGNPMEPTTEMGVMAREDLTDTLSKQVQQSVAKGARVLMGNQQQGTRYQPTVLANVAPGMPAFEEELFGPVAAVVKARDRKHAIQLMADTRFGLGTMLFTQDRDGAQALAGRVADGSFFVNDMVKSDPRLPFGGIKASGYGRELARDGLLEFVNKKTVYMNW